MTTTNEHGGLLLGRVPIPQNTHMELLNSPGYANTRLLPQSIQQFGGTRMRECSHQGLSTGSPNMIDSMSPSPEPRWEPTTYVDLVASKWKLHPADRKELHEFAKVRFCITVYRPENYPATTQIGRNMPKDNCALQIYSFACQLDIRRQYIALSELEIGRASCRERV